MSHSQKQIYGYFGDFDYNKDKNKLPELNAKLHRLKNVKFSKKVKFEAKNRDYINNTIREQYTTDTVLTCSFGRFMAYQSNASIIKFITTCS